jgi:predicted Mrr-cat superfamily restriction endonuclease
MEQKSKNAFILRIAPGGMDKMPEALETNQIIIGWAEAGGLLDSTLTWEPFREIIRAAYYSEEPNLRRAGAAAGHMWRFIREMKPNDLVVVPYGSEFFIAEVSGPAVYVSEKISDDSAYRRPVKWLNNKKGIPRKLARSALIARMKIQGTNADATDILDEINNCLTLALRGETRTFQLDLESRLVSEVLDELRSGRIDDFGFERLIQTILVNLGAETARIIPRSQDKGADIVAIFRVAGAFQQKIAVQAKHWQPEPSASRKEVEELIRGIEAETADLGMFVTSGTVSEEAAIVAEEYFEETGVRIELVDGEQLAKLIVEHGI